MLKILHFIFQDGIFPFSLLHDFLIFCTCIHCTRCEETLLTWQKMQWTTVISSNSDRSVYIITLVSEGWILQSAEHSSLDPEKTNVNWATRVLCWLRARVLSTLQDWVLNEPFRREVPTVRCKLHFSGRDFVTGHPCTWEKKMWKYNEWNKLSFIMRILCKVVSFTD